MCQLLIPSPSGRCLAKLAIFLVFCCFAESAAGSCIKYGHSCWGAHGKRSNHDNNAKNINLSVKNDGMLNNEDARWFITRLLQTNDNRLMQRLSEQVDENPEVPIEEPKIGSEIIVNDGQEIKVGYEGIEAPAGELYDKFRLIRKTWRKQLKSMNTKLLWIGTHPTINYLILNGSSFLSKHVMLLLSFLVTLYELAGSYKVNQAGNHLFRK